MSSNNSGANQPGSVKASEMTVTVDRNGDKVLCGGRCSTVVAEGTMCDLCGAPCHKGCLKNHKCGTKVRKMSGSVGEIDRLGVNKYASLTLEVKYLQELLEQSRVVASQKDIS